jgi:hypothetical protein
MLGRAEVSYSSSSACFSFVNADNIHCVYIM